MTIRDLSPRDEGRAMRFAAVGMHFDWYCGSGLILRLYSRYFWYVESSRATLTLAAYEGDALMGVLLAELWGEPARRASLWRRFYVRVFRGVQSIVSSRGGSLYEETNAELLARYKQTHRPDGEIIFLAADPEAKVKGIGTALLNEFERRAAGKEIYLFTDDACTWQFYEHRGFERAQEKKVTFEMGSTTIPLTCLMYSKAIKDDGASRK